jgi:hypothetical protein
MEYERPGHRDQSVLGRDECELVHDSGAIATASIFRDSPGKGVMRDRNGSLEHSDFDWT